MTTPTQIIKAAAEYYGFSEDTIISSRRYNLPTEARHVAMLLTKEMTRLSLSEIGIEFGNRDHSTVSHAIDRIRDDAERVPRVATSIERVRAMVTEPGTFGMGRTS